MPGERRRVAVIGSGVAGLTAAHVLAKAHRVELYEADSRLGGHAHTHELPGSDGRTHHVDSGFIVHNRRTYPNLVRLFAELDVATQESEMSMSVRCEGCGLEYAGALGPAGVFAQPRNALRPAYLAMLVQIPAFHRAARRLLAAPVPSSLTLGEFLRRGRYTSYFTSHFMIPLVSAVWSCDAADVLRYPARHLFQFLDHHGMLDIVGSPTWRTVTGGSHTYVERITKQLDAVHSNTPVRAVHRPPGGGVDLHTDLAYEHYDAAVIAVHPDQALRLLAAPTRPEREVLGAFRYSRNAAILHGDTRVLPRAHRARASWNYLLPDCRTAPDRARVSYDMNRLQRLDAPERYLVTLGEDQPIAPERVLARMTYEHPVFSAESVAATSRLPALSGPVLAYAGAYHGWGFHEDGCRSGVAAAAALGVPWT
ncbi:NAD(P)/FAD-dependent oxidoreductase [Streptomyces sp. NPDC006879]|uniref:NAD(P)/FAD-dependent oxidoreductase n=1 Tax=Streptomyces sp. NPDC006879 TaxID=3364767 RepID=UPI0036AC8F03